MMQGVAIAAAIKGSSYQQAIQSFFAGKGNPQNDHSNSQGQNTNLNETCFSCGQMGHFSRACPQGHQYSFAKFYLHSYGPQSS